MKAYIKVIVLVIVLIGIGLSPIVITEMQNKHRLNQIYSEKIKKQSFKKTSNIITKVKLIGNSKIDSTISAIEFLDDEKSQNLILKELSELRKQKIIPLVDLNQEYTYKKIKQTSYFDSEISLDMLTIIWTVFDFPDFKIEIKSDINTGVIYAFSLTYERAEGQLKPKNFFQYLTLNQNYINKQKKGNTEYYYYDDGDVQFHYLYNKDDKHIDYHTNILE